MNSSFMQILSIFIIVTSIANLIRMMIYLIGSDMYAIQRYKQSAKYADKRAFRPTFSIVVPAHNESAIITQTLDCLMKLDYPANKLQIVIADDGSTDDTVKIVRAYKRKYDKNNNYESQNHLAKAERQEKPETLRNR